MGDDGVGMQHEFAAAAEREAMRSRDHGEGCIFHRQEKRLSTVDIAIERCALAGLEHVEDEAEIGAGGEGTQIIVAENESLEVAAAPRQRFLEHVEGGRREAVHLGMQLETGDAVPEQPKGRRLVSKNLPSLGLCRGEGIGGRA